MIALVELSRHGCTAYTFAAEKEAGAIASGRKHTEVARVAGTVIGRCAACTSRPGIAAPFMTRLART
jgi:hypothetical protein